MNDPSTITEAGRAPLADHGSEQVLASTCWECSVRCGSLVHVRDGHVVRVHGNNAHPYSQGAFCVKGSSGAIGELYHPSRLLYPLRRAGPRGAGRWERISWDEAIALAADEFTAIKRRDGPLAIAGAVSSAQYSRGVHVQQLLRCLGSPNVMINQDLCQGARFLSDWVTGLNCINSEEVGGAACIFVVGRSPSESHVVQWIRTRQAKRAGARIVLIDPRRTKLAELADLWLRPAPGTDVALALAIADVIIREGLYDRDFVDRWCSGLEAYAERAANYPPEIAERITGVPAEQIVAAARLYASTKPAAMSLGHGVDSQSNAVQTARAYHSLIALTGNLDVPGGNRRAKRHPGFLSYWDFIRRPEYRLPREIEARAIGADAFPLWSGPESWAVAAHNPSVVDAILTGRPYPVRGMYISGVNVAVTYPGSGRAREALESLDFLFVASSFLTPTAQLADVVVPKTVTLEEEDVALHPGGPCLTLSQRAVEPRGEARPDGAIAVALRDAFRTRGALEFELMPWNSHDELLALQLRDAGLTVDDLRPAGFVRTPFEYRAYDREGFRTPSGRIELYATTLEQIGQDPLPAPAPVATATAGLPLRLMTGIRTMAYHHSRFREQPWARRAQSDPELTVHPTTAAARGLGEGDWAELMTDRGADPARFRIHVAAEAGPEIVLTGMGWWYPERSGRTAQLVGNVNNRTSYGPPWDPILGCPDLRGIPCDLRKAAT